MRILAIFDSVEANESIKRLRRRHSVSLVFCGAEGMFLLESEAFDLILCSASFDISDENAFEILKSIREISQIPFICCKVSQELVDADCVFESILPKLGAQGYISNAIFHSPDLSVAIDGLLSAPQGKKLETSRARKASKSEVSQ